MLLTLGLPDAREVEINCFDKMLIEPDADCILWILLDWEEGIDEVSFDLPEVKPSRDVLCCPVKL